MPAGGWWELRSEGQGSENSDRWATILEMARLVCRAATLRRHHTHKYATAYAEPLMKPQPV